MGTKSKKIIFSFIILLILITPIFVLAGNPPIASGSGNPGGSSATISLDNPIGIEDPRQLLGVIINAVLGIVGSLALVVFIVGGITWMVSGGSPDKIAKGKNMLIWATLGLAIIFLSYVVLQYIFQALVKR